MQNALQARLRRPAARWDLTLLSCMAMGHDQLCGACHSPYKSSMSSMWTPRESCRHLCLLSSPSQLESTCTGQPFLSQQAVCNEGHWLQAHVEEPSEPALSHISVLAGMSDRVASQCCLCTAGVWIGCCWMA